MWEEKENGQIIGLTLEDLKNHPRNEFGPRGGRNGRERWFCPVHGSDRQRSFQVNIHSGHFKCFSCGVWGYIDEINKNRPALYKKQNPRKREPFRRQHSLVTNRNHTDYFQKAQELSRYLKQQDDDGIAVRYLKWRGISKETALRFGLGFAGWGKWPHYSKDGRFARQWKRGRLVFPHTDNEGRTINLYGRAIGANDVPHKDRHDNLPGPKGAFNAVAFQRSEVFVTEGAFDALSLIQAGYNAVAIFGISGFNADWVESDEVIFCFDQDDAGDAWRFLAVELLRRGKRVSYLDPASYKGYKDINDLWALEGQIEIITNRIKPQGITG
ncbi:toprim domain-containing protein [Salinithrix halophila]|uniref:Toprim domain-containing protein n=1 Tax=Salinithrix halophila TaxID=1485204 RepID=A0ABV8JBX5_9BACL